MKKAAEKDELFKKNEETGMADWKTEKKEEEYHLFQSASKFNYMQKEW